MKFTNTQTTFHTKPINERNAPIKKSNLDWLSGREILRPASKKMEVSSYIKEYVREQFKTVKTDV